MNKIILILLALPCRIFAQENYASPQVAIQTANYFGELNNANNIIQADQKNQQAVPPAQVQQSSGNFFGSEERDNSQAKSTAGCKDCDEVKKAIKEAHLSSGSHHKKSYGIKKWSRAFSSRMKMKKIFARKYKVKTTYAICFNWH